MLELLMSLEPGVRFALALPIAIAGAAVIATVCNRF